MRIDQVMPSFSYGDAIGNHALALRDVLRRWGFSSEIFSHYTHELLEEESRYYESYLAIDHPDNILVYHYSIGSVMSWFYSGLKCRKVIIYHNVTPGRFFQGVNRRAQRECDWGRQELAMLSGQVEMALGDSDFNRQELEGMGFHPTGVLPIFIPFDDYRMDPDGRLLDLYGDGRANILHVGRFVPNKKVEDIIKTFHFFRRLVPDSRLILVGTDVNMENYSGALKDMVGRLELDGVVFTGHVTFPEMLACYRTASLYLVMSEHEGFCVPLLESMIMGVPVVAFASTAVPGTLSDGGLIFEEKDYPVVAELMNAVLEDEDLRRSLVEAGRRRLEHFQPENRERILAGHLSSLGIEIKEGGEN
jgi:glycosyltransferase involved in cell wall biosynthesis